MKKGIHVENWHIESLQKKIPSRIRAIFGKRDVFSVINS